MKLSKSIVIFLFFSSFLGAFFYALHRTNGNGFKSVQFALYFLAIQIGLISPNVDLKFNQHQPNQQLVSSLFTIRMFPFLTIIVLLVYIWIIFNGLSHNITYRIILNR